jgi:hypothetical protein
MEGFRYYYEQALRAEDSVDWAAHSLDYGIFKKRLLYFRKRRSTIKSFLGTRPIRPYLMQRSQPSLGPKCTDPHLLLELVTKRRQTLGSICRLWMMITHHPLRTCHRKYSYPILPNVPARLTTNEQS